jgi:NAD(P)-dependent dehydrogenase (short-subunit alcohol dehydrogenase family)
MTARSRRWLISGVSSGIGSALAEQVARRGDTVIGTVRKHSDGARLVALGAAVRPVMVDLTDPSHRIGTEVRRAIEWAGGLDVLVNNAGYGLVGAVEELSEDESRHQMETNFWGAWKLIRAALPALRACGDARIINVSSIAGFLGTPGLGMYNASKFALEGLSEALALELAQFGVHVTVAEPGAFRTKWAGAGLSMGAQELHEYAELTGTIRSRLAALSGQQAGDPERAAAAIVALVDAPSPPKRIPLGPDAVKALQGKVKATLAEVETWMNLATSTNLVDDPVASEPR